MSIFDKFRNRFNQSESLRKVSANVGWLFFDKILRMGVGLWVGVWVARYLGPEQYGLWNYALAFTSLFGVLATLGLDSIVVRDIVKEPLRRDEILGSAFFLKLIGGAASLILTIVVISIIKSGNRLTLYLVALSSLGFVFQSINVINFYYQSQIKSKYTVYSQNAAFVIIALFKIWLLLTRAPLLAFAVAGMVEIALSSLFLIATYRYNRLSVLTWSFNGNVARQLLKDCWPIILADMAIMVYMRVDQVMLGQMAGDREVGIFSAAVKISEIWYFIPMTVTYSLIPVIIATKERSEELYYKRLQKLFNAMALFGISVALAVTFLSDYIILLLFGASYSQAAPVLTLHVWAGVFVCVIVPCGIWLTAENLQKYSLYRSVVGGIVNVILNIVLIPAYGAKGSAAATVIAYGAMLFSWVTFRKTRIVGLMMTKSLLIVPSFLRAKNWTLQQTGFSKK